MSAEVGMPEESSEQEGVSGRFALGLGDEISRHCLGNTMRVERRKGIYFAFPFIGDIESSH